MTKTINPMLTRCSALALSTSLLFVAGLAQAQSFNGSGVVVEGDATIAEGLGTTDITVQTQSAVIDWTPDDNEIANFSEILFQDAGTTATFTNGTGVTNFAVLNRILPTDVTRAIRLDGNIVSQIQNGLGSAAGGTVFFYTPGGIVIGPNATIDVGSLGLTTAAPLTDGLGNFIVNDQVQFQPSASDAAIQIEAGAQINALNEGSFVAMFAPRIGQFGDIAVNGSAALVAGEAGTITFSPDGLFDIEVTIGSDAGTGIDHRGSTGGPSSSAVGDNHRAYLVAVPKNTAVTLAVNGGSQLGFDIAQTASLDGNTVVLSAGHNIVSGEIDLADAGGSGNEAFINLGDFDEGFGPGLTFSSQVDARALTRIGGFLANDVVFAEDTRLSAGEVVLDFGFGGVRSGSLIAQGDFEVTADTPVFGQDVGSAALNFRDGSTGQFDQNVRIASRANVDANVDGAAQSNFAALSSESGAIVTIAGDLVVDAGIDLRTAPAGPIAVGGLAQLVGTSGGTVTIGGVTRLLSEAFGAAGTGAEGGSIDLLGLGGTQFTTGELNVSVDAFGGVDEGFGAGNATGGRATILLENAGSSLTVLSPNVTGNAALGELDFLSSEAFGADGITGDGGDALNNGVTLQATDGATINLPSVVGSALAIRSSAIGGDTSADNAIGGEAVLGTFSIFLEDSVSDLGRLAIASSALGGSALGGTVDSAGGNAFGVFNQIAFNNSDVDVAFDLISIDLRGGAASIGGTVADGTVSAEILAFSVSDSTVDILSDLTIRASGFNGDGTIGDADEISIANAGSAVVIAGSVDLEGGFARFDNFGSFNTGDPSTLDVSRNVILRSPFGQFGIDAGGAAFTASDDSTVDIVGNVTIESRASSDVNGDAEVRSGNATISSERGAIVTIGGDLRLDGGIDLRGDVSGVSAFGGFTEAFLNEGGLMVVGGVTRIRNDAFAGLGGSANAGESLLTIRAGASLVTGELNISADATGGEDGGVGAGDAQSNSARILLVDAGTNLTVLNPNTTGDAALGDLEFLSSQAFGGDGIAGNGGGASTSEIAIRVQAGATMTLPDLAGSPLLLRNTAIGGDTRASDSFAGDASLGATVIEVFDQNADLGRLSIIATGQAGSAVGGAQRTGGGSVFGGQTRVSLFNTITDVAFDDLRLVMRGGDGSADGQGGGVFSQLINFNADNATLNIGSDLAIQHQVTGGSGGIGGSANASGLNVSFDGSDVSIAGDLRMDIVATGGFGLDPNAFDPLTGSRPFTVGGEVGIFSSNLTVNNTVLDVTSVVSLTNTATGGDGNSVTGGTANSGAINASVGNNSTLNAAAVTLRTAATGGSTVNGGIGSGGSAITGEARLGLDLDSQNPGAAPTLNIAGNLTVETRTVGGDGSENQFDPANSLFLADTNGGSANSDNVSVEFFGNGSATVGGDLAVSSRAVAGDAPTGVGGQAAAGSSDLFIAIPTALVNAGALLESQAFGGSGQIGGQANSNRTVLRIESSATDILGASQMISTAFGGDAGNGPDDGRGGDAFIGGFSQIVIQNSDVQLSLDTFLLDARGGDGSAANRFSSGGDANSQPLQVFFDNSDVTLIGNVDVINTARGGDGFSGGSASGVRSEVSTQNGGFVLVNGDFDIDALAIGGNALGASFDDAANGGANAFGGGTGGSADAQGASLETRSPFGVDGVITIRSEVRGGDAVDGDGGFANTFDAAVSMGNGGVIDAEAVNVFAAAVGGSVIPGGNGNGGDASSGAANFFFDNFDIETGERNPNSTAALNADFAAVSTATGGDAGDLGGNGGAAISAFNTLNAAGAGQLSFGGNVSFVTEAMGGTAANGLGGSATAQGAFANSSSFVDQDTNELILGTDISIAGDLTLRGDATGGDGQTGGDANGPTLALAAQNATFDIAGTTFIDARIMGGNALASAIPGNGGAAIGGVVNIRSESAEGDPLPTLVSMENLTVDLTQIGGAGGQGLNGADGGQGGEAEGGNGIVLGRAFDGTITVRSAGTLNFSATGGKGGDGVNGGDGGFGISSGVQLGTSSGAGVLGPAVNGAANYDSIAISSVGVGGDGGNATTGTGGKGGDGQGAFLGVLSRGAPVVANTATLSSTGQGGDGGAGVVQGDGGDGVAGFVSALFSEAFQNPGRGSSNIGSLTMRSEGISGDGATPGSSFYATGGRIEIDDSDVVIGTLDIQLLGTDLPDFVVTDPNTGEETPVAANPFEFELFNATLDAGSISLITPGEVFLTLEDSTLTANLFSIVAGALILPEPDPNADPNAPLPAPGTIDIAQQLSITATQGDLLSETNLISGTQIILNAPGAIQTGDLTAPEIFLDSGNGMVSTGNVDTFGGAVSVQAEGTLDLEAAFASVTAQSINARSINGDILATENLALAGAVVLEAGQSVFIQGLTAESITATALGGGIITGDLSATNGVVTLDALRSIDVGSITALDAIVSSSTGGFSASGAITLLSSVVDIDVEESIVLDGVIATTINATSRSGDITSMGLIDIDGDLTANAGGSVLLNDVRAANITAIAQDLVSAGLLDAPGGAILLDGGTGVSLFGAVANTLNANAGLGAFDAQEPINLTGAFEAAGQSISLSGVSAESINALAVSGAIDFRSLNAIGAVTLESALDLRVDRIIASSVTARTTQGDIISVNPITLIGAFDAVAAGSITLSDVAAGSISASALGGDLVAGTLTAETGIINLSALGSIAIIGGIANALMVNSDDGDIEATDLITLSGAFDAVAAGSITLSDVAAGSISASALGGDLVAGTLTAETGTINLSALGSISIIGGIANALMVNSDDGDIEATDLITLSGAFDAVAAGSITLADVSAGSITASALGGDILAEGALLAMDAAIDLDAAGGISLLDIVAGSVRARSQAGNFSSGGLMNLTGLLDIEAEAISLTDANAGEIAVISRSGDIFSERAITAQGTARFNSSNDLVLGDLSAAQIFTRSQGATQVSGSWTAGLIEVVSPLLEFADISLLDAGSDGQITLISTNENGVFVGDVGDAGLDGEGAPVGYFVTEDDFGRIQARDLFVVADADFSSDPDQVSQILVGTLDLEVASQVDALRFGAGADGLIRVIGAVSSAGEAGPQEVGFQSGRFELNTDTGSLDLSANGGRLTIAADTIVVADGALIGTTNGDEGSAALIEAFNAPGTEVDGEAPPAALNAGAIELEGSSAILIQNSGTQEAPVGFIVGSAEGLQLRGRNSAAPIVVINGQIAADGTIITGNEAADAILEAAGEGGFVGISAQSQINGCELGGCILADEGEITGEVSAQVNGVIDTGGTGSGSGGTGNSGGGGENAGGGDTGGGDTGGGTDGNNDTGSDGGDAGDSSDDGSGDEGTDEDGSAGAGADGSGAAGSGDSGSDGGAGVDNADDGGGGNEDFVIDEGSDDGSGDDSGDGSGSSGDDTSGGDEGGSDEGGDNGADGADDDATDEGGADDAGADDDSSDESDGSDEDNEASDDEGEGDDEGEDSEESEEESEDEDAEEEEEEAAEEEEDDGEGPTSGPISAPAPLINTNNLEQDTTITDPISGTGNPALLDPDIDTPETPDTEGQE